MANGERGETQLWEALAGNCVARTVGAFARAPRSTRSESETNESVGGILSSTAANKLQNPYKTSEGAAVYGLRGGSIRKKIIGHGMRAFVAQISGTKHIRRPGCPLALVEKPARQHGGGVLLHPLIQQSANFLAEIGRVGQTGQFKTLQGVSRSGKKELPGWLRRACGHRTSVKGRCDY
jgi:hypothetical protein